MEGFSERARVELRATGEHLLRQTVGAPSDLTPEEAQISQLVAQGASNPEIAAQLFISRAPSSTTSERCSANSTSTPAPSLRSAYLSRNRAHHNGSE